MLISTDEQKTSAQSERAAKRPASDEYAGQAKKTTNDANRCEEPAAKLTAPPTFVSAAALSANAGTNIQMMAEISDEELLKFAIQFEKEHPQ